MGLGSEFGDILDALRKNIADSLQAIGRGGGDVAAARAAEDIAQQERAARQLDLADFLGRIKGKEVEGFKGSTVEDELRALREAELADTERALRERVGGLSGLKKAALAGLGIGGAGLAGLGLYSYLNRNQSSLSSSPYNLPSSPYNLPPTNLPNSPSITGLYNPFVSGEQAQEAGTALQNQSTTASPSAPGAVPGTPSSPSSPGVVESSPSSPSSPSGSLENDLNKKVLGVPVWVWIVIALVIIALVLYFFYHKKHKHG